MVKSLSYNTKTIVSCNKKSEKNIPKISCRFINPLFNTEEKNVVPKIQNITRYMLKVKNYLKYFKIKFPIIVQNKATMLATNKTFA